MVLNPSYLPAISPSQLLAKKYPLNPVLGLVGTLVGTLSAISLIPEDPHPAGALFSSATAMAIGLSFAPVVASIRQPRTALRAEHLLVLAPIYWLLLDLLQSVYDLVDVDKPAIEGTFVAIGLFVGGVWLATLSRPWQPPKLVTKSTLYLLTPNTLFKLVLVFFGLGIIRYAIPCGFNPLTMLFYLGQNRWSAPWTRGQLGGWDAFLDHMSYFGYLLPTLTVLLALRSRWLSSKTMVSIILTLIMAIFLGHGGNRRVIGVIFGAAIIVWILEQKHFKLKQIIGLLTATSLLLFCMQWMLEYRNVGYERFFDNTLKRSQQYEHLHVDDNFLRLGQIIDIVPERHPFVYEKQILFTLIRPIPRVFWPDKPTDPGFDLSKTLGLKGVSLSSSVIGEWYLSAGWLGVLFGGWFYGRLASTISRLLLGIAESWSSSGIVYSLALMAVFAGFRSMLDLILMSYALIAWIIISKLLLQRQKLTNS